MQIQDKIQQQISENKVMVYMKGTPQFPQCGFSSKVIQLLKQCQAEITFANVLEDPELRQGIKDFSNWPTIPQVYINGEFIGGSDILAEMFEAGELQKLV
jgi:monothiol glutaredoxin